jgi:hypothetical protein
MIISLLLDRPSFHDDLQSRAAVIGQGRTTLKHRSQSPFPALPAPPHVLQVTRGTHSLPGCPSFPHPFQQPGTGALHPLGDTNPVPVNPVTSISMGLPTPLAWNHESLPFWIGSVIPFRAHDTPESKRSKMTRSIPGPADSAGGAMRSIAAARRLLSGRIWNPVRAGPGSLGRRVPEPRSGWTTIIARRIS